MAGVDELFPPPTSIARYISNAGVHVFERAYLRVFRAVHDA